MNAGNDFPNSDIAVIAFTGRFPGAATPQQFWENLCAGVESLSRFTEAELRQAGISAEQAKNRDYIPVRGAIDSIDLFDARFFGMTPREAEDLDPQHRIFLELCWEVLERAGYGGAERPDSIAVFAGASANTYFLSQYRRGDNESLQLAIAGASDFLATRVAYKLNLRGPCLTVQSACSTSLVAVHLACQSLLNGEADMALAGGISVAVPNRIGYLHEPESILSPEGRCRPFDAGADGTVPGNGGAVVALKRLEDALRDRDVIHAVIRGSAVNNDGSGKVGFTAPSVGGQAAVIAEAIRVAGLDPARISYVEAHGTGTRLGDPIEVHALQEVFAGKRQSRCLIGSVKSNIGHLDAAAGVAGIVKVILALKNKQIPPTLHFNTPNPEAHLPESVFQVNSELVRWESEGEPLRAGLSSFGIGGTNAHVVLEEAPPSRPSGSSRDIQILSLSAKTRTALQDQIRQLTSFLENNPQTPLPDIGYTLHTGRAAFPWRAALAVAHTNEAISLLKTTDHPAVHVEQAEEGEAHVVFMFPGQGSQFIDMGRELYSAESVFRDSMDKCASLLTPHLGLDIRNILYPGSNDGPVDGARLTQTFLAQPCLFATEFSLATLCAEWGIRPQAMIGHSIGEYVAACLAGVMSLESALRLVALRGRLMQSLPAGAMVAVPLNAAELSGYLQDGVSLAASNSSLLSVISGPEEPVAAVTAALERNHITHTRLHTSHAFHSGMMDPIGESFIRAVAADSLHAPQTAYISNLTGTWMRPQDAVSPDYYGRHLRGQVRFAEGLEELFRDPAAMFLEVGPGNTLTNFAKYHANKGAQPALSLMRHPQASAGELRFVLDAVASFWARGGRVDWSRFYLHQSRNRVELPAYPFERQRFWRTPAPEQPAQAIMPGNPRQFNTYYPSWKADSESVPRATGGKEPVQESLLVFLDDLGVGGEIAHRLKKAGRKIFMVAERGSSEASAADMEISFDRHQDYGSLWQKLNEQEFSPGRVLYFSCLTAQPPVNNDHVFRPFLSLLCLAQSLAHSRGPIRVQVICNGLQPITGLEALHPSNALLLGPCRVMVQELSDVACGIVDIDLNEIRASDRLMERLFQECLYGGHDDLISYRGLRRWLPTIEDFPAGAADGNSRRLRNDGAYIIFGDESPTTANLVTWLNTRCGAAVVMVRDHPAAGGLGGRSSFQELEREFQENGQAAPRSAAVQASLDDPRQLGQIMDLVQRRWGALHGVFLTVSVASGGLIQARSYSQTGNVLRARVSVTLALEKAVRGRSLDFVLLFSSTTAITGGIGQVDACSANAYSQAFAARSWSSGDIPAIAVLWDPFEWETWPGPNLEAASGLQDQIKKTLATFGITREQMEAALDLALAANVPELIVSRRDLPLVLREYRSLRLANIVQSLGTGTTSQGRHPRPELKTAYVAPRDETEIAIAGVWEELFGFEQIGTRDKFFDLGGSSLLAIQMVGKLRNLLKQDFSMDIVFTHQTIAELAEYLAPAPQLPPDEMAEVERLMAEMAGLSPEERLALFSDQGVREGEEPHV